VLQQVAWYETTPRGIPHIPIRTRRKFAGATKRRGDDGGFLRRAVAPDIDKWNTSAGSIASPQINGHLRFYEFARARNAAFPETGLGNRAPTRWWVTSRLAHHHSTVRGERLPCWPDTSLLVIVGKSSKFRRGFEEENGTGLVGVNLCREAAGVEIRGDKALPFRVRTRHIHDDSATRIGGFTQGKCKTLRGMRKYSPRRPSANEFGGPIHTSPVNSTREPWNRKLWGRNGRVHVVKIAEFAGNTEIVAVR